MSNKDQSAKINRAEKTATRSSTSPAKIEDQTKFSSSAEAKQAFQQTRVDPQALHPHDLLRLQRSVGNRAVQRLIASRAIQAKLTVGAAHDPYEEEADAVAEQVMRMPTTSALTGVEGRVHRATEEDEEELQAKPLSDTITPLVQRTVQEEELQTKRASAADSFETGEDFENRLNATRGGGTPLPDPVRGFMEPRFGADFSGVRLHTDGESAQLNREVSAQAFTLGQDIYLGEGKTDLTSNDGKQLLAHELTHVVQQTSPVIRRRIGQGGDGQLVKEKSSGTIYRAQWNEKWQAYDLFSASGYVMQVKPDDAGYALANADEEMTDDFVDGATAVTEILKFLTANMPKDSNYCVALLGNDDLIIAKVNGVTDKAAKMAELQAKIEEENIEVGRTIYLAQKYNTALGSNHAEMCILAAANAMGQSVTEMGCTGPNCPYCAAMLSHEGINSRNAGQDGKAQQGWAHPTQPVFWGSQVSNASVTEQVKDLKSYLQGNAPQIGKITLNASQGKYTQWL